MRVFVTHHPEDLDAYFGRSLPRLREMCDVVLNPLDRDLTTAELLEYSAGCHVIIAHRSTPGEAALFERHDAVVAFLRTAVDISTIDVDAASAQGIVVARADKSFVPTTAELALGLLIDVWRNIASSTHDYRRGIEPAQRSGRQLRGKTAGIIGLGAIGRYLAELLVGIGMEVVATDTAHVDPPDGVELVDLDALLERSDAVFPLAPAMPETTGMIDARALASMRAGAVLINVSRGELVDEAAVAEALDSGQLAGFGCDVGSAPDQRPDPVLAARADVVATPHLGGLTPENADAQAASAVDQVELLLDGTMPIRAVNTDAAHRLRAWWTASGITESTD